MLIKRTYRSARNCRKIPWTVRGQRRLVFALLLLVFQSCRSQPATTVPPELVGTWRTDHAKYAGLYFQITPASFAFSTPEGSVETYTLTAYQQVEASTHRNKKAITHRLRGAKQNQLIELTLSYDGSGGGAIRFANRGSMVWIRGSGPAQ